MQVDHMKETLPGSELMYMVAHKDTHYCGGTERDCRYLEHSPWVPYFFLGSLSTKGTAYCAATQTCMYHHVCILTDICVQPSATAGNLRVQVETLYIQPSVW